MKTFSPIPFAVVFFLLFLMQSGCKKDKGTDPEPQFPFLLLDKLSADEHILQLVPHPNSKMLALSARGTVFLLDELTLDSLTALSAYDISVINVTGDTLLALGYQDQQIKLLLYHLPTDQILVDEPAPSQSLYPGNILGAPDGTLYAVFHKDVTFFVSGYSDLCRRVPNGDWEKFRVTRGAGGIINLGGAISSIGVLSDDSFWFGTSTKGLGNLVGDSIYYHERPFQAETRIQSLLPVGNTLYMQIDELPFSFLNGTFTDLSNGDDDFVFLSSRGILGKGSAYYYLYDDAIYRITTGNIRKKFPLEELVGDMPSSHDIVCGAVGNGKLWISVKDVGVFVSDEI